jgi:hypothetical protein
MKVWKLSELECRSFDADSLSRNVLCRFGKTHDALFSCESTSSAMVITSIKTMLKSTTSGLVCKVRNMLTCNICDSSIIIGLE